MKSNKSGFRSIVVITIVLVILFNVVSFVIPFAKINKIAFLASYVLGEFVIIGEGILIAKQLCSEENRNQRILGLPIIYFGYVALVTQLIITTMFYLCNAFIGLDFWVVVLVESVMIAYFIVQISIGFYFKNRVKEYKSINANTSFMDDYRVKLKNIISINNNKNIEKELIDLLELALGSDPITNEKTVESEEELNTLCEKLSSSIEKGSEEQARELIEVTKKKLLIRNALCKHGK